MDCYLFVESIVVPWDYPPFEELVINLFVDFGIIQIEDLPQDLYHP